MSIKKSKTNEAQPDFDDMMSEVEEELEVQQIEQNIADRVPELRKLNDCVDVHQCHPYGTVREPIPQ